MTYTYFIGIDIGKDFFEVGRHDAPRQTQRFSNNTKGLQAFAKAYAESLSQTLVVLEATGGYETLLLNWLLNRQICTHRADPRTASYFIRSLGKRAKTDRLDADALARYGQERHRELRLARPPEPEQATLQALLARREDLLAIRVAESNRLKHPRYRDLKASVNAVLNVINAQIKALEASIESVIAATPRMKAKFECMIRMKGVGKQTAFTLLGQMPELGTLTRRQAASLAGCAPHPKDSGKTAGYRATAGGRAAIKRALFMAAMAARNFNTELKNFYQRLVQNGKKPMVALTAIMRKLITIINAKVRDECYA